MVMVQIDKAVPARTLLSYLVLAVEAEAEAGIVLSPATRNALQAAAAALKAPGEAVTAPVEWVRPGEAPRDAPHDLFWVVPDGSRSVLLGAMGHLVPVRDEADESQSECGFWCGDDFVPASRVAWCAPVRFPALPPVG
jgi:hypothetical protein